MNKELITVWISYESLQKLQKVEIKGTFMKRALWPLAPSIKGQEGRIPTAREVYF